MKITVDALREYAIECAVVMQMENSSSGGNSPEQNQATRKAANFVDALVELIEARTALGRVQKNEGSE